ncbi:MAG TPA: NAD(P)-dependent oxidoreductase [Xanthobacteraceae bacterium]|nr:NAD(P)-dependent oxidoreductase [Xanthobacteraceae bacterium]
MSGQTMSRDPVGLIGVGLMGTAFAHRLRGAGLPVVGFDVDPARLKGLVAIGGETASSIAEVARRCPVILIVVFSADQADAVIGEITAGLRAAPDARPRTVVLSITCDPERTIALAQRAAAAGLRFIEAPVSGTSDQVLRGDGVGLLGADAPADAEPTAIFDALMPRRFHVGKIGDGAKAKLAVNLILNLNRLALAEGLALAERMGLDANTFFEIARGSAAHSQVMDTKGGKMVSRDFTPHGRAAQALKDVRLMLAQAARAGQQLPACEVAAAVLESCVRHGEGDLDSTVIVEDIRRRVARPAASQGGARS